MRSSRGYLAGSGWKEYRQNETVCGIRLPAGLRQCDPAPGADVSTPATKEESGHDINDFSFEASAGSVAGSEIMGESSAPASLTLRLYQLGRRICP